MTLANDDTNSILADDTNFGLIVVILIMVEPNVGLEVTKGVGKVVVQELHGILELVSCDHFRDNICCWNNALGGNGFH